MTTTDIVSLGNLSQDARSLLTPDLGPTRFVHLLESHSLFKDAVLFLAHGLPVEIAISWAWDCSLQLLSPAQLEKSKKSLKSIEDWLVAPNDDARWSARQAVDESDMSSPVDLIAMAIFLSGGSISPPELPIIPPPAYISSKMVAGSIQLAVLSQSPERSADRYRKVLEISRGMGRPARK